MRQTLAPEPRPTSNGPAAASLTCAVLGLLPCLPAIGSVVAVPFGVAGLKCATRLEGRGKRMAAAGLILGLIGIVLWSVTAFYVARLVGLTGPAMAFIRAVNAGDFAAARANATSNVTDAKLADLHSSFQSLGKLQTATLPRVTATAAGGVRRIVVTGTGEFAGGTRVFRVVLLNENGVYKVDDMSLE